MLVWLHAFRLRTLPLALSSIITGSSIAYSENPESFNKTVLALCLLTTLFLQILSNLANDYGDHQKGTDNDERIGPKRAVQSGLLSFFEIKAGIILTVILSLLSGTLLLYQAFGDTVNTYSVLFFALGLGAIAAAIKYTIGENPYGYRGLGDVFVLLFFGLVGVGGSYYLLSHTLHYSVLLPSCSIGFFAAGVLNLNNMRDHLSDAKAGKNTLVVKMGLAKAKQYHRLLIIAALLFSVVFVLLNLRSSMQFLFIITLPLFRKHLAVVKHIDNPAEFDPLLKQLAIATFIFSVLFAVGLIIGN